MPSAITRIDFGQFRAKNPNFRIAFEELCYHLFCREFKATSGVGADFNEAGLETKPILHKGTMISFVTRYVPSGGPLLKIELNLRKYSAAEAE